MIDEARLIDELKQSGMISDNEYGNAVLDMINSQPKIGDWIPCSDRLPENIRTVILHVKEIEKPTFGWYEDMEKKWILSEKDFVDLDKFTVIAWQQLPEAYHGQMD